MLAQHLNASSARLCCNVNCGLRRSKTTGGRNNIFTSGVKLAPSKLFGITLFGRPTHYKHEVFTCMDKCSIQVIRIRV